MACERLTRLFPSCTSLREKMPSCNPVRDWTKEKALKVAGIIFIISVLFIATAALVANLPSAPEIIYTVGGLVGCFSLTAFLMIGIPKFISYCRSH